MTGRISAFCDKIAEWSIYILIFALPFSKSIVEITIVTALISLIFKKAIDRKSVVFDYRNINIALLIYLAFSLISLFNSQYIDISLRALFSKALKFAVLFFIVKEIINTRTKLNNFMIMALVSCFVILVDGFIQHFITYSDLLHNYPSFDYRSWAPSNTSFPTASFPFPNDLASWIIVFIFPVGAFAFWGRSDWRMSAISVLALVGLLYLLLLTKARGAFAGFLVAFGVLSVIKMKRLGIILMAVFIMSPFLINRELLPHILSMGSMKDRSVMWQNGMKIFEKHPIIGNGINTFFVEYREARSDEDKGKRGSYAHNCYLQMACDTGILGLLSFLVFVAMLISRGFSALKKIKDPLLYSLILGINLGLIAFLTHSAVDTNLYSLPLAALFWLSAGLLLAVIKIAESNA